jgi:hypothetical protein
LEKFEFHRQCAESADLMSSRWRSPIRNNSSPLSRRRCLPGGDPEVGDAVRVGGLERAPDAARSVHRSVSSIRCPGCALCFVF